MTSEHLVILGAKLQWQREYLDVDSELLFREECCRDCSRSDIQSNNEIAHLKRDIDMSNKDRSRMTSEQLEQLLKLETQLKEKTDQRNKIQEVKAKHEVLLSELRRKRTNLIYLLTQSDDDLMKFV